MLAFDVDYPDETLSLATDLGAPGLLDQDGTHVGTSSILPSWNPAAGLLVEQRPDTNGNLEECSLFDVSGISLLTVVCTGGNLGSSTRVALGIPKEDVDGGAGGGGTPSIPLPAAAPLLPAGLGALGAARRLTRRRV